MQNEVSAKQLARCVLTPGERGKRYSTDADILSSKETTILALLLSLTSNCEFFPADARKTLFAEKRKLKCLKDRRVEMTDLINRDNCKTSEENGRT